MDFNWEFHPSADHDAIQRTLHDLTQQLDDPHILVSTIGKIKKWAVHPSTIQPASDKFYSVYLGNDTKSPRSMAVLDYHVAKSVASLILTTQPHESYTNEANPIDSMFQYAITYMKKEASDFALWALGFAATCPNAHPDWLELVLFAALRANLSPYQKTIAIHIILIENKRPLKTDEGILHLLTQLEFLATMNMSDLRPIARLWFNHENNDIMAQTLTENTLALCPRPKVVACAIYSLVVALRAYYNFDPIRISEPTPCDSYTWAIHMQISYYGNIDLYKKLIFDNAITADACIALVIVQQHTPTRTAYISNALASENLARPFLEQLQTRFIVMEAIRRVFTPTNARLLFEAALKTNTTSVFLFLTQSTATAFIHTQETEYLALLKSCAQHLTPHQKTQVHQYLLTYPYPFDSILVAADMFA